MPLFEVYNSMMKEKARAAAQAKNTASSPEPFSTPENEFGELIWDKGPRKKTFQGMKDSTAGVVTKLATGLGEVLPAATHELFPAKRLSTQFGLNAQDDDDAVDDEAVPWITYDPTAEEELPREISQEDYCAEFLNEFDLNSSTLPLPGAHRSSSGLSQVVSGYSDHRRTEEEDGATGNVVGEESGAADVVGICSRAQDLSQQHDQLNGERSTRRQQKQGRRADHVLNKGLHGGISATGPCKAMSPGGAPSGGGDLINFSHFLRPVAVAKASLEGHRAACGKLASGHETTSGSKPLESTLVNSGTAVKCVSTTTPLTVDAKPATRAPHEEAIMVKVDNRADANSKKKDVAGVDDYDMPSSSFAASAALSRHEGKRLSETAEASSSSSSSSGNSDGEASNNYKRRGKRKHCEVEEEEEEESGHFRSDPKEFVGNAKRARDRGSKKRVYQRSAGTKRHRASEMHNMSERRRRDRINERMKTLQELIPNCNKVDKASMLEEAIEYLKSLQFQLQMMSMGGGAFCMPQTVPRCMQNFRMPTMTPPFPAMGMGLGFGMGMGMGMYDMNGTSNPMFPVPSVHQFASAYSLARAQTGLRGAPAAVSPQMFGAPRQGTPVLMPRPPLSSLFAPSTKANMASVAPCRTSAPLQPGADPLTASVNSKDKRVHGKAVREPNKFSDH